MDEPLNTCPYLGIADDPDTSVAFPSESNCCYHARPLAVVQFSHQQDFCLHNEFVNCPVFLRERENTPLPSALRAPRQKNVSGGFPGWLASLLVLVVLILVGVWFFGQGESNPFAPVPFPTWTSSTILSSPTKTVTATLPSMLVRKSTSTPESTSTSSLTATQTSAPTATLSGRALEIPIGKELKFVIHRVQNGDSLAKYAIDYKTSEDAIQRVNYSLRVPLWADALVVIPVGFTNVMEMPYFQPYKVTTERITIEELAKKLEANLEELEFYNVLKSGEQLSTGDWLLIPWAKPAPVH